MTEFILSPDAPKVRERVLEHIRALADSKRWRVTVVRYQKRRTLPQNALFHKWVDQIATETGNDNESTKDALKAMFLPPRIIAMGDELKEVRQSTAALNVADMAQFMTRVQGWAASEGIALPQPEEMHDE
jgi:hypothetical protein